MIGETPDDDPSAEISVRFRFASILIAAVLLALTWTEYVSSPLETSVTIGACFVVCGLPDTVAIVRGMNGVSIAGVWWLMNNDISYLRVIMAGLVFPVAGVALMVGVPVTEFLGLGLYQRALLSGVAAIPCLILLRVFYNSYWNSAKRMAKESIRSE